MLLGKYGSKLEVAEIRFKDLDGNGKQNDAKNPPQYVQTRFT